MLSHLHDGLRTCSARGGVSAEGTWVQQKNVKISILLCIDSRLYPEGGKKKTNENVCENPGTLLVLFSTN